MQGFLPKNLLKILTTAVFSLIFLVAILIRVTPVHATEMGSYNPYPSNTTSDVQNNLHNHTQEVFMEFLSTVVCQISGVDITTTDHRCLGFTATGQIGYINNQNYGALGMITNGIIAIYSGLPIHTADYVAYLHNNFGVTHPAYAADQTTSTGYQSLSPLINIWVVMRNVTYLLTVIIFIFIGFAVMMRVKIDPRTVMTIENQIPKIIIGLILITFSFAIAGLMVDLMYMLMFVFYNIYASIPGINTNSLTPQVLQGSNPWDAISAIYPGGGWSLATNAGSSFATLARHVVGFDNASWNPFDMQNGPFASKFGVGSLGSFNFISFIVDIVSWLLALRVGFGVATTVAGGFDFPFAGVLAGAGAGAAVGLVVYDLVESSLRTIIPYFLIDALVLIALFIAMVRLFIALLTAWVTILYYVVLAPLLIFFGLIPGVEGGFTNWIRHLASYLFVYPLTAAILMLGSAIIQSLTSAKGSVFVPPLVGGGSLPVGILLGLVVVFVASSAPQMAKDMFKVKDDKNTAAFGALIGQSTGMVYKGGRATYAAFGKVPMPGARGGFQAALGQLG